ncbi:MAG: group III truncated hemoglobin [Halioglobus sp.]
MSDHPRPDLDTRENVELFVDRFYEQVLNDEQLAPIFLDVAQIDLNTHLPHIKNYWCKLVLNDNAYHRHTMNIHRQLNAQRTLVPTDFERWLNLFCQTLDDSFTGPHSDKARRIAGAIAANMQRALTE